MTKNRKRLNAIARFGFKAALGTALLTLLSFGIAIATPPLSGPFCRVGCHSYPYLDIASRFPRDYYWMFPAMLATLFYVAFMIALHARSAPEKRVFSQLGLALSVISAMALVGDYFLQIAAIQPGILSEENDGISFLTQYNPHGIFIALEELGYILMSASLACMVPALSKGNSSERWARWSFLGGAIFTAIATIAVMLTLGHAREYVLEIAIISINWLALVMGALLMARVFYREAR